MKKGPILIALLVIAVIVGFAYFRLVLSTSNVRPLYDAVPESASIIFEFKDFSKTKEKLLAADYAKDLQEAGFINKIVTQLNALDNHFSNNNFKPASGNEIVATLHLTDLNHYAYLYLISVGKKIDRNQFKALILAAGEKIKMKERTFKEEPVYDFYTKDGKPLFTLAKLNGIMMASENASLVEEALIQMKEKKSLLENSDFNKVKELAGGDSDVLLYLNFKNLISLESLFVDGEKNNLVKNLSIFSEWLESDIMLEQKAIIINGYTLFNDPKKSWISQFTYKPADKLTLPAFIPEKTALFLLVSNNNNEKYFSDLKDNITDAAKLKYIQYFKEWTDDEWAFGMNEPLNSDWQREIFLIVKNEDSLIAKNKLAELAAFAKGDSVVNNQQTKGMLKIGDALNDIYGKYLLPLNNPHYAVAGNYTIFANDAATLNNLTSAIESEQTLARNIDYLNFSKNISSSSNLYLYINSSKLSELLNAALNGLVLQSLQQDNKIYQKFSPASVQFSYEENLFFTSAYINYRSAAQEKNNLLWKLQIDTVCATPSRFVINHHTKESEVILQDVKNRLYLISRAGKIIWKKELSGRIISDIKQIDFYNNGRYQYLFNTERELHLIDREGNYVTNFPLRLPDKATAGLMLANYKDANLQRIFIPCNDRIYGYEISGKPLQGWNPKQGTGNISHPMQHHVFEGKDYLVAMNDNGKIFLLDRKGDNRIEPIQLKEPLKGALQPNVTDKIFELAGISKNGTVYKLNQNGNVKEIIFSEAGDYSEFRYLNVKDDNRPEYVFVYANKITAYNDSLNITVEINIPATIDGNTFIPDSRNKSPFVLGLPSATSNRTFILQSDGTIFDDFIINGFTPFDVDIYGREKRNTIVTSDNNGMLYCYKLD
jgi:hypothetical protein